MQKYVGYIFILLSACCWGIMGVLSRFCLQDNITPLEICFWRMAIGATLFLIHAYFTNSWKIQSVKDAGGFALFGIFGIVVMFSSLFWVVKNGGAALAAVMLYTAPAWVAIVSRFIHHELITVAKAGAILLSLIGVACISFTGNGAHTISLTVIAVGVISGMSYASHFIYVKSALKRYSPFAIYGFSMLFGMVAIFPFVDFMPKSLPNWWVLCTLGVISTYFAYWLYCEGMKMLEPTRAAIIATLEPVIATISAWVVWGESFTAIGWLGGVFVLTAVFVLIICGGEKKGQIEQA